VVRITAHHIQRTNTDRSRGTQDGNTGNCAHKSIQRMPSANKGAAASRLSMRSRIPP
jgi:hypothetical protein